jgi:lysophospholipase L1-like esterase
MRLFIVFISLCIAFSEKAYCSTEQSIPENELFCPSIMGVVDFNCDGKVVISIIGDSFVYGIGDDQALPAGYVARASQRLSQIKFNNFGYAGMQAKNLYRKLLTKGNKARNQLAMTGMIQEPLVKAITDSDYVILDLGRNDRWNFEEPRVTLGYINRTVKVIKSLASEFSNSYEPLVIKAILMLPNRGSQGPWVKSLNDLLVGSDSLTAPADLRFDKVSKRLLLPDQLHPSPRGYSALSKTLVQYLQKVLPVRALAARDRNIGKVGDGISNQISD